MPVCRPEFRLWGLSVQPGLRLHLRELLVGAMPAVSTSSHLAARKGVHCLSCRAELGRVAIGLCCVCAWACGIWTLRGVCSWALPESERNRVPRMRRWHLQQRRQRDLHAVPERIVLATRGAIVPQMSHGTATQFHGGPLRSMSGIDGIARGQAVLDVPGSPPTRQAAAQLCAVLQGAVFQPANAPL